MDVKCACLAVLVLICQRPKLLCLPCPNKHCPSVKEGSQPALISRTPQTTAAPTTLTPTWKDSNIALGSTNRLMRALVMSVFMSSCETWTLTAELERRAHAKGMRCYREILRMNTDHVTNVEVHNRIQHAIGARRSLDYSEEREAEVVRTYL